ncbi:RBR-type E3 ubiquitin transferase [Heracleum sosnowskyi]|uniref:RanBP-type and C3HC4-type zinc finger-containing protein 1 n=1 Tax=Heracleum sosnowskyi TaxID=360622 RepID=A0AAD8GV88_9APIA|nr:RBR-type E3 ubiquitin transferase [Heracleum sosnowskyi]
MDFSDDSFTDDNQSMYDDESLEPMGSPSFDDKSKEIKETNTYKVLTKAEIQKIQEHVVTLLSTALTVPRTAAAILLRNYKWNVDYAQEAWFNDEDGVRESVGLLKKPIVGSRKPGDLLVCGICFEDYVFTKDFENAVGFCGHKYCGACLKIYISVAISNGPGCLFLRCPDPGCGAVIGEDMVDLLVSDHEDKRKFKEFLFRSYVDLNNNKIKWCPTADCECAIECELGSDSYGVTCNCLGSICWHCVEDSHRPVDCITVGEWIVKNTSEYENVSWIHAYTKPCPKCKVPIEKNSGCMRMTCKPPCGFVFCWICLDSWNKHGYSTCNGYMDGGASGVDKRRSQAKEHIERYLHYYERWAANHNSREKALADLRDIKAEKLQRLEQKHDQSAGRLKFITEAWEQIVECRRVLKWSYVYGYFMPQEASKKIKLFEFLQGEAEVVLERLHNYAENKLNQYIDGDANTDKFNTEFRKELTNLTSVTGRYFANFLKRIEYSLPEAECGVWQCQICTYLNEGEHKTCFMCLRNFGEQESGGWQCQVCTFQNESNHDFCSMCANAR